MVAFLYQDSFDTAGALAGRTVQFYQDGFFDSPVVAWEAISGTWNASNGKAVATQNGNNVPPPILVLNTGSPNVTVEIDISGNGGDSIYFRVVDANNWWRVTSGQESDGTYFSKVQKCVAGTVTTVYQPATQYQWDTMELTVDGNQLHFTPGTAATPVTLTSEHSTATRHGIGRGTSYYQATSIDNATFRSVEPFPPYNLKPTSGSVKTTSYPTLEADREWYLYDDNWYDVNVRWELATDSGFTQNVRNLLSSQALIFERPSTHIITGANRLQQTQWYMRARCEAGPSYGTSQTSVWSTTQSFTVTHTIGTLNHTPKDGQGITPDSPFLSWAFSDSDTSCVQTAYQVIIELNSNGQVLLDTGKVSSSQDYYEILDALTLSQTYPGQLLRWKVKVWDLDDKPSNFSNYNSFYLVAAPSVNIIQPAPNEVDYPYANPTFVWSIGPSGRTQVGYGVEVYESVGGALGATVYVTGYIPSSSNMHSVTQPFLETGKNYIVIVTIYDNYNLIASSQNEFSVTYTATPKPVPDATAEFYLTHGYVLVSWLAFEIDPSFLSWRIYRRELGTSEWTRITEITQSTVGEYHDYLVPAQTTQEYYVTQVADRFGTPFESTVSSGDIIQVDVPAGGYWLIDPLDSNNNQLLHNVTDDPYTIEFEQTSFNVIGRGRHTDIGDEIGVTGTITAQLRNSGGTSARAKKRALEGLKRLRKPMRLRNPFGDIYHVSLGQIGIDRVAGVGADEFVDVTIPYEENYEE